MSKEQNWRSSSSKAERNKAVALCTYALYMQLQMINLITNLQGMEVNLGSSFYSLALVCSTIFQLLKINSKLEKEYAKILMETEDKIVVIKEERRSLL